MIPQVPPPRFSEELRRRRLAFLDFSDRDRQLLQELVPVIEPQLDRVVDAFYGHLTSFPQTRNVFRDQATVQRLKAAQKNYLMQALRGPYDESYFQLRWRIGYIHNILQVEPEWFIGAIQLYHRLLYPLLVEHYRNDPQGLGEHALALDKVMNLDMQVALDSYWTHYAVEPALARGANRRSGIDGDESKSQFLANMSHELRTPLSTIIGFTEVLKDDRDHPVTAEQREYLDEVYNAGKSLLRLVDDILDLSQVESGVLELVYRPFRLETLLSECVSALKPEAERQGLDLQLELPGKLGVVQADQARVKQIVQNLLSNALKFTARGRIRLRAERGEGRIYLQVCDTGIGIAEHDLERVFDEFSRVEDSHTSRSSGTGIGLALTRRLVQAHRGQVWVESEPGVGSIFHVVIPDAPPARPYPGAHD